MKVYDCKCEDCQAEFQAILEDDKDKVKCPSCNHKKISKVESDSQSSCGGGCGSCGGCASE